MKKDEVKAEIPRKSVLIYNHEILCFIVKDEKAMLFAINIQ